MPVSNEKKKKKKQADMQGEIHPKGRKAGKTYEELKRGKKQKKKKLKKLKEELQEKRKKLMEKHKASEELGTLKKKEERNFSEEMIRNKSTRECFELKQEIEEKEEEIKKLEKKLKS